MSGRVASPEPVEIGVPPLAITKLPVGPPTSRETNTWCTPLTVSSQATHGVVGLAGFIVPPATRGFSASLLGSKFSEHADSAANDSAHPPNLLVPLVSSTCWGGWLPTTCHSKPPLPVALPLIPFAANTIWLLCSP